MAPTGTKRIRTVGVQVSATACICALRPVGVSPTAKAVSIASASAAFFVFERADARPSTARAMSRMRALANHDDCQRHDDAARVFGKEF